MQHIAIVYHSAHGHTAHIAHHVLDGTRAVPGVLAELVRVEDLAQAADRLLRYDGVILGSPTYLGGVSGPFKTFMDSTGRLWKTHQLKNKLAAGFTVSSLPAGDKHCLGFLFRQYVIIVQLQKLQFLLLHFLTEVVPTTGACARVGC